LTSGRCAGMIYGRALCLRNKASALRVRKWHNRSVRGCHKEPSLIGGARRDRCKKKFGF
jgi:hypothetical protein